MVLLPNIYPFIKKLKDTEEIELQRLARIVSILFIADFFADVLQVVHRLTAGNLRTGNHILNFSVFLRRFFLISVVKKKLVRTN